jgi:hypothetical protein
VPPFFFGPGRYAQFRASDADREHVATTLRKHATAGRLTMDELSDRLETVYRARTLGELEPLIRDLPGARMPVPEEARPAPVRKARGLWLAVAAGISLFVVFLATTAPVWLVVGMLAVMAAVTIALLPVLVPVALVAVLVLWVLGRLDRRAYRSRRSW